MDPDTRKTLSFRRVYLRSIVVLGILLSGCTAIGPDAIRNGRLAYIEAINETGNQQMLKVLVGNRYDETNTLLAVSSVTANISLSSSAQVQAGVGDSDDYEGNLVPFSGGFVYEENPTISYTPVSGERYLRQIFSPIPVSLLVNLTHSLPYPEYAYEMLLSSVNGVRNPAFLFRDEEDDPRYSRFVEIMADLTHWHCLYWVHDPDDLDELILVIRPESTETATLARELLEILGIGRPVSVGEKLSIPARMSRDESESGGIGLTTRTIYELLEILSAAVQVPTEDEQIGVAARMPRPGRVGRDLAIRYAESSPERAYVALQHRSGWFYIDDRDQYTKRYFKLMGNLWSAAMAKSLGEGTSTPVLTVPVSR